MSIDIALLPHGRMKTANEAWTFVDPSTPLHLREREAVCTMGHVYNQHLDTCPWCHWGLSDHYRVIGD